MATGGNGYLNYRITPQLPVGVAFYPATRSLGGTPTVNQPATTYSYTVFDTDGDTDTLTFTIEVVDAPVFTSDVGDLLKWVKGEEVSEMLPLANRAYGISPFTYSLTPQLPNGVTFTTGNTVNHLRGTPSTGQPKTTYTYTVTDANGETDTLTFTIWVLWSSG